MMHLQIDLNTFTKNGDRIKNNVGENLKVIVYNNDMILIMICVYVRKKKTRLKMNSASRKYQGNDQS